MQNNYMKKYWNTFGELAKIGVIKPFYNKYARNGEILQQVCEVIGYFARKKFQEEISISL